jgi:hypothetical protein
VPLQVFCGAVFLQAMLLDEFEFEMQQLENR